MYKPVDTLVAKEESNITIEWRVLSRYQKFVNTLDNAVTTLGNYKLKYSCKWLPEDAL